MVFFVVNANTWSGWGRDSRPQLDLLLKDTVRRRFDVAMVWAVDRLGRSLPDLIASMQELHGAKVVT